MRDRRPSRDRAPGGALPRNDLPGAGLPGNDPVGDDLPRSDLAGGALPHNHVAHDLAGGGLVALCRAGGVTAQRPVPEARRHRRAAAHGQARCRHRRPGRGGRTYRRERADRGAATILLLAVGLLLIALGLAGAAVGVARVARHQARTAADLGALAGAMRVLEGPEAACARARELVTRNGGRLASCTVDGLDLLVAVEVDVTPLPGLTRTARAAARAGPIRAPPGWAGSQRIGERDWSTEPVRQGQLGRRPVQVRRA